MKIYTIFYIFLTFSLTALEQKRDLSREYCSEEPSRKRQHLMAESSESMDIQEKSDEGFVRGFVQGVVSTWNWRHHTQWPCKCIPCDSHMKHHLYELLHQLDKELCFHNGEAIVTQLIDHLIAKKYLLDTETKGMISAFAIAMTSPRIQPILRTYNEYVAQLNRIHHHDFSSYELPYYS